MFVHTEAPQVIDTADPNRTCERPRDNWLVFTAGCMGAGKGHTLNWLNAQGLFPLDSFVRVSTGST